MQFHLRRTFKRLSMPILDMYGEGVKVRPRVLIARASSSLPPRDQVCQFHARLLGICGVALVVGLVMISCSTPQKNWTSSGGPLQPQGQMDTSGSCGKIKMDSPQLPTLQLAPKESRWDTFRAHCSEIYQRCVGSPSVNLKTPEEIVKLPFSTSGPTEIKLGSPPMWTNSK